MEGHSKDAWAGQLEASLQQAAAPGQPNDTLAMPRGWQRAEHLDSGAPCMAQQRLLGSLWGQGFTHATCLLCRLTPGALCGVMNVERWLHAQ